MLPLLVNIRFQVLFHSPPGVLFTFPSRYSFSIGHQVVFSLGGWSPLLPTGFLVSCGTPDSAKLDMISRTRLSLSSVVISITLPLSYLHYIAILTPNLRRRSVWAPSRSLAATQEIVLTFFSSGY